MSPRNEDINRLTIELGIKNKEIISLGHSLKISQDKHKAQ